MKDKLLLTGAGGFLGGRLAQHLSSEGYDLRLLVHRSVPEFAGDFDFEIVRGDITDRDGLGPAMSGCSAVVHTAAVVKTWIPDRGLYWRVNVEGLKNVVDVGLSEGIEKILYTSSFIALGHSDDNIRTSDDELPTYEPFNEYEATKREALGVARDYIKGGAPLIVAIPGVIYGPGALTSGNLVVNIILDRLRGKDPFLPRMGEKEWNFAYIEDVVEGHLKLLRGDYIGEEMILGGENRTLDEFWDVVCQSTSAKRPRMIVPFWVAKIRALLYDELVVARLIGREPNITRGVLDVYKHSWALESEETKALLEREVTGLEGGLKKTVDWLIEEGLVGA